MASTVQTPPRTLPGAYLQTPATRAPLFRGSSYQSPVSRTTRSPQAPGPSPARSLVPISNPLQDVQSQRSEVSHSTSSLQSPSLTERAARTINDVLVQESRFPELDSYLTQGYSCDYENQTSTPWTPFQKTKMYNIPDPIFEQYNRAQVSTSMGLFAELNHAWVAIDNAVYLWDYTNPHPELIGYESQPNSITTVKLAKPRPGVFLPAVTHILIISTTAEIIVLGLGRETDPGNVKSLKLFNAGMSTSVRGLDVSVIASSDKTGRIFFGGRTDNDVYELSYQQEERWFSSKCAKVNHTTSGISAFTPALTFKQRHHEFVQQMVVDDTRNLLYTLSSDSTIKVFHMSADGSLNLAITRLAADIYSHVGHLISANETLNPKTKIVSISAVPSLESTKYYLVATTETGYRIYLSATSSYSWSGMGSTGAPTNMQALHVKTPPLETGSTASAQAAPSSNQVLTYQTPANIQAPNRSLNKTRSALRVSPGYFFCFLTKEPNPNVDTLFISSPDPGRIKRPQESGQPKQSTESALWLQLGSRAEDIGLSIPYSPPSTNPGGYGNELAVQYDTASPEIAILTNTGVHIVRRRRLADAFAALLRFGGGDEGLRKNISAFIDSYGRVEGLATALAVACGQGTEVGSDSNLSKINDPEVLEYARRAFIEHGQKPTFRDDAVEDDLRIDDVRPSPRHSAAALYISRLLRSIWKRVIATEVSSPAGGYTILPTVSPSKLKDVQGNLVAVQEFFQSNKSFIDGLSGPDALTRAATRREEVALQGEHRALYSLVKLVSDMIEGISFILVLFEERVEEIVPLLSEESRPQFLQLTYEGLFSTKKGYELAKELVKAIVNRNIARGSNVETIAEALRRKCGSFCSSDDVVIFKAQEQLKRAAEAGGNTEFGRNLLRESLYLFQKVAESLTMDYLETAVKQYSDMQFFAGAISLALDVAKSSDKSNEGLSWVAEGQPEGDPRKAKYKFRKRCYELIHLVILAVDHTMEHDPGLLDGRPTVTATRRNEAYNVISTSPDELFLTDLYDWYLAQGWSDRLLATDSPFIVTYLERKASEDIIHAELLWRFYGQSNRFYEAAQVQFQLATGDIDLSLDRRIECLSRAKANASTYTPGTSRQARQRLLKDITDHLDAANIQDDILQRLKDDPRMPGDHRADVLKKINGQILSLNELFNIYAEAAGYWDLCLLIFQAADYRGAHDIKNVWQKLLQTVHDETTGGSEAQPYEVLVDKLRSLGSKLRMSESTFSVPMLLPMLERYAFEYQQGVGPAHWVVDLFLELQVPREKLYAVLEAMFYNNEAPFHGSNRRVIGGDLVYVIVRWYQETARATGHIFGSENTAIQVDQMLGFLIENGLDAESLATARRLKQRVAQYLA